MVSDGEKKPVKSRWFVLTDWNLNDKSDFERIMGNKSIQFLAFGRETCPDTNRLHNQAFLYFKNARSCKKPALNKMSNWWGEIHCSMQAMHGDVQQNEKYCSKEGQYTEIGDKPSQGMRQDLNAKKKEIMNGKSVDDICMDEPHLFHQYGRTLERIERICMRKKYRTWKTKGIWYYGPTFTGKTHRAYEGYTPETHYVKNLNEKYWNGYTGQETVIYEEFRGQEKLGELLSLVDERPKGISWKGLEQVPFLARTLIVTSPYHPSEVYKNCVDEHDKLDQLVRRFEIVHLTQKYSEGNIGTSEPKNFEIFE